MLIEVLNRNVPVESEARDWIKRRVHFALGRFVARIRRVAVIVEDINGTRGGIDKRCRLRITLIPEGEVVVEYVDSTVEAATALAAERAARSVIRALERQREYRVEPERVVSVSRWLAIR